MQLAPHHRRRLRRISLTPLADLVFILLVFFILETSFTEYREILFSQATAQNEASGEGAGELLRIEVFAGGRLWIGGEELQVNDLDGWLGERRLSPDTPVKLLSDSSVRLQLLVRIMDRLHSHGLEQVAIEALEGG